MIKKFIDSVWIKAGSVRDLTELLTVSKIVHDTYDVQIFQLKCFPQIYLPESFKGTLIQNWNCPYIYRMQRDHSPPGT